MFYQADHLHIADLTTATVVSASETDEQLMARIQNRESDALTILSRRHNPLLRTIISRVVNNDEDTADTVQDVLLEIWNRCDAFDATKGKAMGWIITLARRRAIDRVRRRQAYNRAEERNRLEVQAQPEATYASADEDAGCSERAEALKKIIATLPEAQRIAMELSFYRGLSQREIAKETNTPLGTIKTRLELGLRKVRGAILNMGGHAEWSMAA